MPGTPKEAKHPTDDLASQDGSPRTPIPQHAVQLLNADEQFKRLLDGIAEIAKHARNTLLTLGAVLLYVLISSYSHPPIADELAASRGKIIQTLAKLTNNSNFHNTRSEYYWWYFGQPWLSKLTLLEHSFFEDQAQDLISAIGDNFLSHLMQSSDKTLAQDAANLERAISEHARLRRQYSGVPIEVKAPFFTYNPSAWIFFSCSSIVILFLSIYMCILIDQLEERLDHFDRVAGSQSIDIPERKRILYPSPFIFSRYSNASYVVLLLITLVPPLILQMIILKQAFKFVIFTYYLDELAFALFVVTICLCGSVWLIMRRFKSLIHRALVGVAATVLWTIYYQL